MRSMLLKGRKPGRNVEEEKIVEFWDVNHCYNVSNDFLRPEDARKKKCYAANLIQGQYQERPFPKLLRMPKQMLCRTTAGSRSDESVTILQPFIFKMTDTTGAGNYRLELGSHAFASLRSDLSNEARDGYQLTSSFGRFQFSASFEGQAIVWVSGYNERTGLFNGTLQLGDKRWVSYKMVCDGGPAETGL